MSPAPGTRRTSERHPRRRAGLGGIEPPSRRRRAVVTAAASARPRLPPGPAVRAMSLAATLAVPGDLSTPTGGYEYARRLLAAAPAAGLTLTHLALPDDFPEPSEAAVRETLARLAATPGPLLVDGLAHGALPAEGLRPLGPRLAALHHHPLGLETGLAPAETARRLAAEAAALAETRAVICTSRTTAATLNDRLNVPPERITVALPGLDPAPKAPRRGEPPVVLGVGTISRRKGWDVL